MVRNARRPWKFLRSSAGSLFAATLGTGVFSGIWLRPDWRETWSVAAVAVVTLAGGVWWARVRAARRWQAALDVYAERQIAQERRRKMPTTTEGGANAKSQAVVLPTREAHSAGDG